MRTKKVNRFGLVPDSPAGLLRQVGQMQDGKLIEMVYTYARTYVAARRIRLRRRCALSVELIYEGLKWSDVLILVCDVQMYQTRYRWL